MFSIELNRFVLSLPVFSSELPLPPTETCIRASRLDALLLKLGNGDVSLVAFEDPGFDLGAFSVTAAGLSALLWWHKPCSGSSWLARYTANVRALVALYLRTGAPAAMRLRQEKHVDVWQIFDWQP